MVSRILEPVLLGCISNVIVNILFNPGNFHWVPAEFIVACLLAALITELNHYIDRRLDKKMSWVEAPLKRLITHFLLITVCLLIVLNVIGSIYMWSTGSGFFSRDELVIINSVVFTLAVILTAVKWSFQFYSRWIGAEARALKAASDTEALLVNLGKSAGAIEMQQGTARVLIKTQSIRMARLEFGTVRVYTADSETLVYPGTLSQLNNLLPDHLFFQASRDTIVHREVIKQISSSTFGKVLVTIHVSQDRELTISRPKAATFRKWLNSNSPLNP